MIYETEKQEIIFYNPSYFTHYYIVFYSYKNHVV